jgi:RimJ/RimL family protein N-acetyltransferase
MAQINADPEVTRFLGPAVRRDSALDFYTGVVRHWDEHGFGFWAVESRDTGRLLGFAGVWYPTFIPELADQPEIGWRLARAAWDRGIATEAAIAARDHAFAVLGLPELISIIHPRNHRSQRVATKLGMKVWREVAGLDVWKIGTFPHEWR